MELRIKNMVCDRCKRVVVEELSRMGIDVAQMELGKVETASELTPVQLTEFKAMLEKNGFGLLDDRREALAECVKNLVIDEVQYFKGHKPQALNFSDYLSQKTGYEYSYLSNLFSAETGQTIEHYIIAQKIEKIKEWLSYNELTLSEIAWRLSYSSTAHLSNQFKKVTGLTPSHFKQLKEKRRNPIEEL